ncbi:AraC family transcriptional regulator [Actinacidiphila acididurans]|uniref:AraC family transcriptional regulator n=1 Tax=Actinacidiphila acididurans TaxID=2784346 RepID=A0ABS2TX92_9ACTN|nr:AraC family transcriptional regulator [Actinacidiphila acididurans]MBM9507949.1 AraC family transcriptional regulator [Actinacidiphila acididurans]
MTDPLADLVDLIRPRAVFWKGMEAAGTWGIGFPATTDVNFAMVAQGRCCLTGFGPVLELAEGDFLLMCGPPAFALASAPGVPPADGEALLAASPDYQVRLGSGAADPVRLVGGHFILETANADLLMGLLPRLSHLRGTDSGAGRIGRLLDLVGDEAAADRPGSSLVMPRLVEVVLVEALRSTPSDTPPQGLLAGLHDPQIAAALRAVHADVRRPWTVADLAATAHLSRSVFAQRFLLLVGTTPITYLLTWRMALAKDALTRGRPIDEVARSVGYGSASAFSNAFHRVSGSRPGHYATTAG